MEYRIHLSSRARLDLLLVLEYLSYKWTKADVEGFYFKFEELKTKLSTNPYLFSYYNREKGIRKVPVTKHNMVYYLLDEESKVVKIITIFNVFQDPEKLSI